MPRKVFHAKNGRPYIKLKSGKVRFIKGKAKRRNNPVKRKVNKITRSSTRIMPKKKGKSKWKKYTSKLKFSDMAVGAAAFTIIEPFIDTALSRLPIPSIFGARIQDIAKVGAAYYLRKKKGKVKGVAFAAGVIGVRNIIKSVMVGITRNGNGANGVTNGVVII